MTFPIYSHFLGTFFASDFRQPQSSGLDEILAIFSEKSAYESAISILVLKNRQKESWFFVEIAQKSRSSRFTVFGESCQHYSRLMETAGNDIVCRPIFFRDLIGFCVLFSKEQSRTTELFPLKSRNLSRIFCARMNGNPVWMYAEERA